MLRCVIKTIIIIIIIIIMTEIQSMRNVKPSRIPVIIGAINELKKKTAILGTAQTLREVLM